VGSALLRPEVEVETFREPIQLDLAWWVALPPGKISI